MLQQTQVAVVLDYYRRWMERFPTVDLLAAATAEDALGVWQGLGYYKRCNQLLETARRIASTGLPRTSAELKALPGIGDYTAAAIASNCFGEKVASVDANVMRVYARICADAKSGYQLRSAATEWVGPLLDNGRPGDSNQALMELGAVVCRPRNPLCAQCPIADACISRAAGTVLEYPAKATPAPMKSHAFAVEVPYKANSFGFVQLPHSGWWSGLWAFPSTRTRGNRVPRAVDASHSLPMVRHQVTRNCICFYPRIVKEIASEQELRWVQQSDLAELPIPSPYRRILVSAIERLDALERSADEESPVLSGVVDG